MPFVLEARPFGRVGVAGRFWRYRGRQFVTAIVKATFDVRNESVMTLADPTPVVTEERHYRGNPVASLLRGSDLALHVPRPEIVLVGCAYAGPGERARSVTVRLAVQRGESMLVNKRLEVFGDRRARPGGEPSDPIPFDRMPIQYERALGGISSRDNPVGMGMAPDLDGLVSHPNVALPHSGGVAPAGFGPIPSAWPVRQVRRGSFAWAAANSHADVDVPDDFDAAYFQTAPADQRVSELAGGELLVIVNMHPELAAIRTHLPKARGVSLLQTPAGERLAVPLRMDTVHLEPDAMRAEIVYRGYLALEPRHDRRQLRLAGALEESPDRRVELPDLGARAPTGPSSPDEPTERGHAGTLILEPTPHQRSGTMIIEGDVAPKSLPFAKRRRRSSGSVPSVRTKSATPWAAEAPSAVAPATNRLTSTQFVEASEPSPRLAPRASPAVGQAAPANPDLIAGATLDPIVGATPATATPPPPNPPADPWRDDRASDTSAREAPRPAPPARANFKAGVLKKFKR